MERSIILTIRVHPHAKCTQLRETMKDGSLKIDIAAPADGGKANSALVRFLADHFHVPVSHVEMVAGEASRTKMVKITARGAL